VFLLSSNHVWSYFHVTLRLKVICLSDQDLKDSRTNPEYPDLMVAAISDMQVYNYIKKSFKARNLDDELKKLSGCVCFVLVLLRVMKCCLALIDEEA
jgi:hypothetical protein